MRRARLAPLAPLALLAAAALLPACRRKKGPTKVFPAGAPDAVLPRAQSAPNGAPATRASATSLRVAGKDRKYVLVEPASLEAGRRYPLVLVFHGDGGEAVSFHDVFPFERATRGDAIVAYPDGIGFTWDLESKIGNRDVAFVEALVEHLASASSIDRARVFGVGYSSGGFLVNVIACQKSGLFRAISSSAGGAPYKQALIWPNGYTRCPGQSPIAMMALHGTRDFGVTLDSGRFSAAYWAYVNGCNESEMETTAYRECTAYRSCPAGKSVVWCEVPGLGHWVWDQAAAASWEFFRRHQ